MERTFFWVLVLESLVGFSGGSDGKTPLQCRIPGSGRSPGEGNGNSSNFAWRIPWTEEPGRLQSMGLQRVRHDWATTTLESLVGLHRTFQLQLQHCWSGHRLGLLWYWMVCLETNRDHSVIFEIASKYCISDSFVDYDGYSISSKGLLPTVVDITVIWVKFTHSSPF